jgi:hypothetical protein
MSARRVDRALIRNWRRRVFADGELCGFVHPVDNGGWVAEFRGRVLGDFATERAAAAAVSDAARRRE